MNLESMNDCDMMPPNSVEQVRAMRHLKTTIHPDIDHLDNKTVYKRNAARAIVLDGEDILMLYTDVTNDYTILVVV